MSKQSEAKKAQGHVVKPAWPVCGNCRHFTCTTETISNVYTGSWTKESDKRCTLGGFATGKAATCKKHEWKKMDGDA